MKTRTMLTVLSFVIPMVMAHGGTLEAQLGKQRIPYQHGAAQLEGYLAYSDAIKGSRPGVLLVHEWWGLNDYVRTRVDQLAGMGYVAFALDMYGKGKVTRHPKQAGEWMEEIKRNVHSWRQRALAGLEVLKGDPRTDPNRIAAIGYCFGGATVQHMAYSDPPNKGIVSFHGPLIPPPDDLRTPIGAKILICHGAADPFVKEGMIQAYISAMEKSRLDWQMIIYGGSKHSFTNPSADEAGMDALEYNKSADHRSWRHMKIFFEEIFMQP